LLLPSSLILCLSVGAVVIEILPRECVTEVVSIITNDGKHIVVRWTSLRCDCDTVHPIAPVFQGTLKGFDQTINVVLEHCFERAYSTAGTMESTCNCDVLQ
jgi:hypothetical protein